MAKTNRCEMEIDAIRDEIMEETKHLTKEENRRRLEAQAHKLAEQYGFTIGKPTDRHATGSTSGDADRQTR